MMMDRHVGAPPVSKQQECKSGLVGPGTLSQACDLMWCVKWRGESELSSAHISSDTHQGCRRSWLTDFSRCDYTRGWWRGNPASKKVGQKLRWYFSGLSGNCLWSSSAPIHWILTEKPNICRSLSELSRSLLEQGHCYQQTAHSLAIINPFFCSFCSGSWISNAQKFSFAKVLHFWGT